MKRLLEEASNLISLGKLEDALAPLKTLCKEYPKNDHFLYQLGSVFYHLKRWEEASTHYTLACLEAPLKADRHLALGLAEFSRKKYDLALVSFLRASVLDGSDMESVLNMGASYFELREFERARHCFEMVSRRSSDPSKALLNLAVCLGRLGEHQGAVNIFRDLIKRDGSDANVFAFYGVALHRIGNYDEAIDAYQVALSKNSACIPAYLNWGITCMEKNSMQEAVKFLRIAADLSGNAADARWNLSMALLAVGEYEEGFLLYNSRLEVLGDRLFRADPGSRAQYLERGTTLFGKTVYVFDEQGLGDTIHFSRYLILLKSLGARIVARVNAGIVSLLETMNVVDVWLGDQETPPTHDFQIPLMSLPHFFSTTLKNIPYANAYLQADEIKKEQWRVRLARHSEFSEKRRYIGLMWAGNPMNPNDVKRSVKLSEMLKFLPVESDNVVFVSLTNAMSLDDENLLSMDGRIVNLCREIRDFSDTAALVSLCERVVAVDTSVAHLSGALGVSTALMIPYAPDWRWGLSAESTPWYDSIRLHRQSTAGDWTSVLESVFNT